MCRMRQDRPMITEHVELPVIPGREVEYEAAFAKAKPLIAASPGFRGLVLSRCIERPNFYVLLVQWDSVESHMVGFRESPAYQEWRTLLHHFYDPFPVVEHFTQVATA
jgi:heme-degrading monooxygenase HmoA